MRTEYARLTSIVRSFGGRTIGIVGDFMLDELLRGEATRISPEAPVPVVLMSDSHRREGYPGGAGNVAANLAALGAKPIPFGAIGDDETGDRLRDLLRQRGIPCTGLVRESGRVTPRKVRIVAHDHQLLRLDFERPTAISRHTASWLARSFARQVRRLKAVIVSDYQKGSVTTELCNLVSVLARQRRVPVFVDPKPEHPEICRDATVATPNLREAELMAGVTMRTDRQLESGGRRLQAELGCSHLLITRGADGMTLFEPGGEVHHIPGVARPVYDVTGAGDTVIAVLALASTAGATMREAAQLACLAGGRVVLKFGTSEITPRELLDALQTDKGKS
jgi:D-beta-D-heptose 7-phosphate kinase/D-beta-D-heptose 1-phosphate adenosyltransferase